MGFLGSLFSMSILWVWWIPGLGHKGRIGVSFLLKEMEEASRDQPENSEIKGETKHNLFNEAT